ncbi:Inactive serine protease 45, partial [Ophiophagus hannah]
MVLDLMENSMDYKGKSNLGGSPKMAVHHIEDLVNVRDNRKDYLDPRDLEDICGLANYSDSARWDQKNPWHVRLQNTHYMDSTCRGALISSTWVLTAAHCFNLLKNDWIVVLGKILHFLKKSMHSVMVPA